MTQLNDWYYARKSWAVIETLIINSNLTDFTHTLWVAM